jgi:hypothetical protein
MSDITKYLTYELLYKAILQNCYIEMNIRIKAMSSFSLEKIETIKSYLCEGWRIYKFGLSPAFKASFVISLIGTLTRLSTYSNSPYMILMALVDLSLSTFIMTVLWPIQLVWILFMPLLLLILMIGGSL